MPPRAAEHWRHPVTVPRPSFTKPLIFGPAIRIYFISRIDLTLPLWEMEVRNFWRNHWIPTVSKWVTCQRPSPPAFQMFLLINICAIVAGIFLLQIRFFKMCMCVNKYTEVSVTHFGKPDIGDMRHAGSKLTSGFQSLDSVSHLWVMISWFPHYT